MKYDYSKLKGRIKEVCGSEREFANQMDTTDRTMWAKLNNRSDWKQSEIAKAVEVLNLEQKDILEYFYKEQ